jgi:hypothetical protein
MFTADENRDKKTAAEKEIFLLNVFLTVRHFFELFLLVSSVNLFEVSCKKRKK